VLECGSAVHETRVGMWCSSVQYTRLVLGCGMLWKVHAVHVEVETRVGMCQVEAVGSAVHEQ
jgi:hypothetical protein